MKHLTTTLQGWKEQPLFKTADIRVTGSRQTGSTSIYIVREGDEARQVQDGPMIPGPWGFTIQHSTIIDTQGGSAAERERMTIELTLGEPFTIDGLPGIWTLAERDQHRLEGQGVKLIPHPDAIREHVETGTEHEARRAYSDRAVDDWFRSEGIDPDAMRGDQS